MAPGRLLPLLLLLLLPTAAAIDARPGPEGPPLLGNGRLHAPGGGWG